jgi:hypothetical protein
MSYAPQTEPLKFLLNKVIGLEGLLAGCHSGVEPADVDAILEEAGKFAGDVLAPLDAIGDKTGAKLANGVVTTVPGWIDAYRGFAEGGWVGVDEAVQDEHGHFTMRAGKRVAFVDFEYAGWDDPTTVISNACLHPGIPMPRKYQAEFVRSVMRGIGAGREEWLRLRLIYPLQALKWALILLNPLLSVGQARRKFAGARSARFSRDKIISHVRLHVRLARRALEPEYWLPYSGSGAYTV